MMCIFRFKHRYDKYNFEEYTRYKKNDFYSDLNKIYKLKLFDMYLCKCRDI